MSAALHLCLLHRTQGATLIAFGFLVKVGWGRVLDLAAYQDTESKRHSANGTTSPRNRPIFDRSLSAVSCTLPQPFFAAHVLRQSPLLNRAACSARPHSHFHGRSNGASATSPTPTGWRSACEVEGRPARRARASTGWPTLQLAGGWLGGGCLSLLFHDVAPEFVVATACSEAVRQCREGEGESPVTKAVRYRR